MGQGRRQFTDEFKREAVALLASSGRPLMQIATELGIVPSMLRNWRDRNGGRNAGPTPVSSAAPPPHSAADPAAEILPPSPRERSAADGARYSKKNWGHLLGTPEMRFRLIEDQRGVWPVPVMCAALSVSPSGYYAWRTRPQSPRKIANRGLLGDIQRVHAHHRERYGAPRSAEGQTVSRGRIERVMRQHGIRARAPRRYRVCTTDSKHSLPVAPNLLSAIYEVDFLGFSYGFRP